MGYRPQEWKSRATVSTRQIGECVEVLRPAQPLRLKGPMWRTEAADP
jgi:hypothetical protein